mmetsp:Transcript_10501/g.26416  ORF Transcript_10501/g.26416 Transcript_10501/m.26416 type:complete len:227 (+) Transcript_10501:4260-4940(+)
MKAREGSGASDMSAALASFLPPPIASFFFASSTCTERVPRWRMYMRPSSSAPCTISGCPSRRSTVSQFLVRTENCASENFSKSQCLANVSLRKRASSRSSRRSSATGARVFLTPAMRSGCDSITFRCPPRRPPFAVTHSLWRTTPCAPGAVSSVCRVRAIFCRDARSRPLAGVPAPPRVPAIAEEPLSESSHRSGEDCMSPSCCAIEPASSCARMLSLSSDELTPK